MTKPTTIKKKKKQGDNKKKKKLRKIEKKRMKEQGWNTFPSHSISWSTLAGSYKGSKFCEEPDKVMEGLVLFWISFSAPLTSIFFQH